MRNSSSKGQAPPTPSLSPKNRKKGIRSWLKIQVEPESYQPPRGGMIFLQCLVGILFFVFVVRFWYLQVHKGQEFTRQAQNNRLREERIIAPRGVITDVRGVVLADNRLAYGLSLVREDCHDIPATLAQVSAWTGIPLDAITAKFQKDRLKVKSFEPLLLLTDMDFSLVARIEAQLLYWPGLEIVVRSKRNYPESSLYAHVLGYVAEANEKEMTADKSLSIGDLVGKQGLELVLEPRLRGSKGLFAIEVDVLGRALGKSLVEEPRSGQPARLALDTRIQRAAWDALEGQAGCIVVMDPDTGKLVALVTSPSYDNNAFAAGISRAEWEELRSNPRFPLQNRVIQSVYPPGSVWKLMMTAMMLKEGVRPAETVFCTGEYRLGNRVFGCWKKGGHGTVDMTRALVESCDVYYYQMSEKMGIDRIERFAKASGFGTLTGIDLPHEKVGLVPSKAWKRRRFGESWVRGETLNISIGQGYTLVTPLQMATFVSSLLNGGQLLKPQVLDDAPLEVRGELPVDEKIRSFIVDAMRKTASTGTARVVGRKDADMGGKTGTAQVVKLKMYKERRLKTAEMAYEQRDHAWIATWGAKEGKRYVVIVMVEHGGGGSSIAGPIARKVYDSLFGVPTS